MYKLLIVLISLSTFDSVQANEIYITKPTEYVISGKDRYGNTAYSILGSIKRDGERLFFNTLTVKIYDKEIVVDRDILDKAVNPDISKISVLNDAGVFGSYFYISIPYGERGRCKEARKYDLYSTIYIDSNNEERQVTIDEPCKKS